MHAFLQQHTCMPNREAEQFRLSADTVRMRDQFETYSDGLFSLPLNIPGTPYGKAVEARKLISADIERESPLIGTLHYPVDVPWKIARVCCKAYWLNIAHSLSNRVACSPRTISDA